MVKRNNSFKAGEMTHWLRALATTAEDSCLILSYYTAAPNHL